MDDFLDEIIEHSEAESPGFRERVNKAVRRRELARDLLAESNKASDTLAASDRVCQTPGSQFHIEISPSRMGALVDLPREFNLTEEEAIEMEDRIHDGLEWALAPLFQDSMIRKLSALQKFLKNRGFEEELLSLSSALDASVMCGEQNLGGKFPWLFRVWIRDVYYKGQTRNSRDLRHKGIIANSIFKKQTNKTKCMIFRSWQKLVEGERNIPEEDAPRERTPGGIKSLLYDNKIEPYSEDSLGLQEQLTLF